MRVHARSFSCLSTHPEKLVITPSVFTHLSPPSLSFSSPCLSLISLSHWTHHSAFSEDKEQPQDDNHIRAHNLFMALLHISTLVSLSFSCTHTHTHTLTLTGDAVVMGCAHTQTSRGTSRLNEFYTTCSFCTQLRH